jgi:hypothetical protein
MFTANHLRIACLPLVILVTIVMLAMQPALAQPANEGCAPGFWKQQQHFQFWGCGYTPNTLVSSTGLSTNTCGCNFSSLTMLQALSVSGGPGLCDAEGKLLAAAVAALLNACSVPYPLSTAQIIAEVNTALASCDKTTILAEANRLGVFNSVGCSLK